MKINHLNIAAITLSLIAIVGVANLAYQGSQDSEFPSEKEVTELLRGHVFSYHSGNASVNDVKLFNGYIDKRGWFVGRVAYNSTFHPRNAEAKHSDGLGKLHEIYQTRRITLVKGANGWMFPLSRDGDNGEPAVSTTNRSDVTYPSSMDELRFLYGALFDKLPPGELK